MPLRTPPWLPPLLSTLVLVLAPLSPTVYAQDAVASGTHVVQENETLWQIADAAGTSTASLMALNGLEDGNVIYVGQSLRITAGDLAPGPTSAPPPPDTAAPVRSATHTVAVDETLWLIAQQYGTTVDGLVQANGLEDPNRVVLGSVLAIPAAGAGSSAPRVAPDPAPAIVADVAASPPPPTAETPPPPPVAEPSPTTPPVPRSRTSGGLVNAYTVQPGDTLNGIARQFGLDAGVIAQASQLEDVNRLAVGMVLKIPVPSREYVVQPGETLYGIAARERIDLGLIVDFNDIQNPGLIRPGEVLVLPAALPLSAAAVGTATPTPEAPASTPAPPTATPTPASPPEHPRSQSPSATVSPSPVPTATPTPPRARATPPPGMPTDGMVGAALRFLNFPYVFGGSGPTNFDCSGLVWYAARQANKSVPRGMRGQYDSGQHPGRDELKPGDLVFFQNTYMPGLSHNGIYLGNRQFINAGDEQSGVTISSMDSAYWSSRYFGATRLP